MYTNSRSLYFVFNVFVISTAAQTLQYPASECRSGALFSNYTSGSNTTYSIDCGNNGSGLKDNTLSVSKGVKTFELCMDTCTKTPTCIAVVYRQTDGYCTLFTKAPFRTSLAAGEVMGTVINPGANLCPLPPCVPQVVGGTTYNTMQNSDYAGFDTQDFPCANATVGMERCSETPLCDATTYLNGHCWLKRLPAYVISYDFFVKKGVQMSLSTLWNPFPTYNTSFNAPKWQSDGNGPMWHWNWRVVNNTYYLGGLTTLTELNQNVESGSNHPIMNPYGASDINACMKYCTEYNNCQAVVYRPAKKQCSVRDIFHFQLAKLVADPSATVGIFYYGTPVPTTTTTAAAGS